MEPAYPGRYSDYAVGCTIRSSIPKRPTGCQAHPSLCSVDTGVLFLGGKPAVCEVDCPPPSNVEECVKLCVRPLHAGMACRGTLRLILNI